MFNTLIKQIPALSGEIRIDNKDINSIPNNEVSRLISFVPTTFPSIKYLKTIDYVSLGRTPHTNALGQLNDNDKNIVMKAIESLKLNHLIDKFTDELSDGERQMVSIARALSQETPRTSLPA